ncbi:MAG TPA: lysophospholipid acyltransferase family protein [Clostridia bacterium]
MKFDYTKKDYLYPKWYIRLYSFLLFWILVPVLLIIKNFILGVKVKGKENYKKIKKQGAVIVANHVHEFDAPMIGMSILPRRMTIISMENNFTQNSFMGWLIYGLGARPIPNDLRYMKQTLEYYAELAKSGKKVLIYPEGHLVRRCPELREFKTGAFRIAVEAGVPILPVCYTYRGKKLTLNFLEPIYAQEGEDAKALTKRTFDIMNAFFTEQMAKNQESMAVEEEDPVVEKIQDEEEAMASKHA